MVSSEFWILRYESLIRCGCFIGILLPMGLWEMLAPCRHLASPRWVRWLNNGGLLVVGTLLLRAIFPLAAVGMAAMATEWQWGLFYVMPGPDWQHGLLAIICLDMTTYWQHRLFHKVPALWRFHQMHHADPDFDVTTGLRFHPIEILLSMIGKAAVVLLLGAPVMAVLLFEVLLNGTSMFNHGNVRLLPQLERFLRRFVVTPDMHRIHHSVILQETNSNFGFNLPWWDHLFGTYRHRPSVNYQAMNIGLTEYQTDRRVKQLPWMLVLPFLKRP